MIHGGLVFRNAEDKTLRKKVRKKGSERCSFEIKEMVSQNGIL